MNDDFDGDTLDPTLWLPFYLPHWSSREAARARYAIGDGTLRLLIEEDQPPWCPEFDGWLRVSSLQTALVEGQHRFRSDLVVREPQQSVFLFAPRYGRIEARARAIADPANMVSLWLIDLEDDPRHSAEICVFEIFGRDVKADQVAVGMGVHPFGDPGLRDDFSRVALAVDVREFHVFGAEWRTDSVVFLVDGEPVKQVDQSPAYAMQLMLGVYEFADGPRLTSGPYPKEFAVDWVRVLTTSPPLTTS